MPWLVNRRQGKGLRSGSRSSRRAPKESLSGRDVLKIYQQEVDRKRSITRKADFVHTQLLFAVEALKCLYAEEHFSTILCAENLTTLPQPIARLLENKD